MTGDYRGLGSASDHPAVLLARNARQLQSIQVGVQRRTLAFTTTRSIQSTGTKAATAASTPSPIARAVPTASSERPIARKQLAKGDARQDAAPKHGQGDVATELTVRKRYHHGNRHWIGPGDPAKYGSEPRGRSRDRQCRAATASMRTQRSHRGGAARAIPSSDRRISGAASTWATEAAKPAITTSLPNRRAPAEKAKNAEVADAREETHPVLLEAAAYATANAASPTRPKRIPTAIPAAKCGP